MKAFLKENIAIVAAIVLPLLLVVMFMVSTAVTTISVAAPKHDFLIATDYYNNNDLRALNFDIIQGKLVTTYHYPAKENNRNLYTRVPKLWRVYVEDMSVAEISIPLPADKTEEDKTVSVKIDIPDLQNVELVNRQPGPDGYTYERYSKRYRGNLMTEIFSYDSYDRTAVISNAGRVFPLKGQSHNQYRYNSEFIGWIVSE